MKEAREIQKRILQRKRSAQELREKAFKRLPLQGKISPAMKFIDHNASTMGVHSLTQDVVHVLKVKDPTSEIADKDIWLEITKKQLKPVI